MRNDVAGLMEDALSQPKDAVMFHLSRRLAEAFPDRFILESESWAFNIHGYAREGLCTAELVGGIHSQVTSDPLEEYRRVWVSPYNAWYSVGWKGSEIEVVSIGTFTTHCRQMRHFVVAPSQSIAEAFFLEVCEWNAEVRAEVLVYNDGWTKDPELFEAIQNSTLDNLILEGNLKQQIREDFESFFRSRRIYERYQIPWKRGVLLLGPPGNGKTHCIKALVNLLGFPCLYARTFQRDYGADQGAIQEVFQRARQTAPCILVLEDIDSLLNGQNRSFFLNELDGFAANSGLMVVATTNHPERLDPAILDRPSRFDRKYTFNLPDHECRTAYLVRFSQSLEPEMRLDEDQAADLARHTEGFSYAYLKELFLSAMMAWIHGTERPFAEILRANVETLREQMHTADAELPDPESEARDEMSRYMARRRH